MKIRHAEKYQESDLRAALSRLQVALTFSKRADCPKLSNKIRSAIKSAGGAMRHLQHRLRRAGQ